MSVLSRDQRRFFRDNGFLTISGFFEEQELATASEAYEAVWRDRPRDVTVDTEITGRRIRATDMTEEERRQPFKVNDLFLRDQELRGALLSARLGSIIKELLSDDPVICNTLSLEYGSQQADHLDTLFMTPRTEGRLVATWMALEDVHEDAGPLRYYPGSNHIEPFRFSTGSFHVNGPEMPRWTDYMAEEVENHGLAETRFLARRGDLFVWDAWLLHGGSEICVPGLTRKSLVTHYFTKTDCLALGSDLREAPGGYWMHREPPAPRGDAPMPEQVTDAGDIPVLAATPTDDAHLLPERELHERLSALDIEGEHVGP